MKCWIELFFFVDSKCMNLNFSGQEHFSIDFQYILNRIPEKSIKYSFFFTHWVLEVTRKFPDYQIELNQFLRIGGMGGKTLLLQAQLLLLLLHNTFCKS